jgi:hypothetical protein
MLMRDYLSPRCGKVTGRLTQSLPVAYPDLPKALKMPKVLKLLVSRVQQVRKARQCLVLGVARIVFLESSMSVERSPRAGWHALAV